MRLLITYIAQFDLHPYCMHARATLFSVSLHAAAFQIYMHSCLFLHLLLLLPLLLWWCLQIQQAFESALRVAAAVPPPEGKDLQDTEVQRSMAWARRQAAEAELKKQLGGLGLDVSGLSLAPKAAAQANDLLSLARPLAALATAETQH